MWRDWVLPRLRERGLGDGRLVRTLRTYGIGESHVAELLGEPMLRAANPVVATYARADWLDVRISAVDEVDADGQGRARRRGQCSPTAEDDDPRPMLAGHVRAEGETTWADLVAEAAARAGVRFAVVEAGTHGALGALLAEVPALERESRPRAGGGPRRRDDGPSRTRPWRSPAMPGVEIGLALVAHTDGTQTLLRAAVAAPGAGWSRVLDLRLFQHGAHGRFRAGVAAAAFLAEVLGEEALNDPAGARRKAQRPRPGWGRPRALQQWHTGEGGSTDAPCVKGSRLRPVHPRAVWPVLGGHSARGAIHAGGHGRRRRRCPRRGAVRTACARM